MSVRTSRDVYTLVCVCAWVSLCWTKNECERGKLSLDRATGGWGRTGDPYSQAEERTGPGCGERGPGGEPRDQQAGTTALQPEACFLLGVELPSFLPRGRKCSPRAGPLAADAKRLSADLHLSFAYISIGPTDWFFENPQCLPTPGPLQWPCLEKSHG